MTKSIYLFFILIALCSSKQLNAQQRAYVDVAGLDRSIKPGDNFFRFVNGRWSDTVKIAMISLA
jgi:putative endopeptidase